MLSKNPDNMEQIKSNFAGKTIYCGLDVHKNSWNFGIHLDNMFLRNVHQKPNPKILLDFLQKTTLEPLIKRHTHKVAISNHRIKSIDNQTVTFTYKDYKDEAKVKLMTLTNEKFIRRFSQHILPKRFIRIRPGGVPHYGILSSTWKRSKLFDLQLKLGLTHIPKVVKGLRINICSRCQKGKMVTIVTFDSRGPPEEYVQLLNLVPSPTV